MSIQTFLSALTGRIFKILPMREAELRGENVCLREYVSSLSTEVRGASLTFPDLQTSVGYITIANILNGLDTSGTQPQIKSEVFKMLRILDDLRREYANGD